MQNLIKVDFQKPVRLTGNEKVSLRDVWAALGVKKDFSDWSKQQLVDFQEKQDFGPLPQEGGQQNHSGNSGAGHNKKEYWVSVDCAKSIAMMSRTSMGKAVRSYFLECERLALDHAPNNLLPVDPIAIADMLLVEAKKQRDRADVAERKLSIVQTNAVASVREHALPSAEIAKRYPKITAVATSNMMKVKENKRMTGGLPAYISTLLRQSHKIDCVWENSPKSQHKRMLFSVADLDAVEQAL